jgi:hypothetical protein
MPKVLLDRSDVACLHLIKDSHQPSQELHRDRSNTAVEAPARSTPPPTLSAVQDTMRHFRNCHIRHVVAQLPLPAIASLATNPDTTLRLPIA